MLGRLATALWGSAHDRAVKAYTKKVSAINALEDKTAALSDEALRGQTVLFKERLKQGETLEALLPETFACVREAARRAIGLRHFDVQLIGGMVLHDGAIAEMKTGEGKTLVATLAAYLNALTGQGVHIVTVNDYLAHRDSQWMGAVYQALGLSVGVVLPGLEDEERRQAYGADITYGTNNEFGFDYLRDNLKMSLEQMVQRDFHYAIVDEVDSILIDEARTPLIISGRAEDSSERYKTINSLIPKLVDDDYEKDDKQRSVNLTEQGMQRIEDLLIQHTSLLEEGTSLYDVDNVALVHHVNQALRAHKLFTRDVDYIVRDGQLYIIDEFTGRVAEGRRYADGLHQALEARETLKVQMENQTLASITYQNYFRFYHKLAGMTGTAQTEAAEFEDIYALQVLSIPTHQPMVRTDHNDEVYRTGQERDQAMIDQIQECHRRQQPVLVGTVSVEKSEQLAKKLKKLNIPHEVLNAKNHAREAQIIAQAGAPGAVTIATNMAGRGTDIQLGGNIDNIHTPQHPSADPDAQPLMDQKRRVLEAGGLYIVGTERHESRRIDNQLRGRSGRQGDPGESKFYISLEDDLMRIFGSERLAGMLQKLGIKEGEAIIHPWISKALEKAQQKVEARNFEIRKQLLRFDDVMNDQRKAIFSHRKEIMAADHLLDTIRLMRDDVISQLVRDAIPEGSLSDQWDLERLQSEVLRIFALQLPIQQWCQDEDGIAEDEITERITAATIEAYAQREEAFTAPVLRKIEKTLILQYIDNAWKDHLLQLDYLRQGIGLRAMAQRNPLHEYKYEAFQLFDALLMRLRFAISQILFHIEPRPPEAPPARRKPATFNPKRHLQKNKVKRNAPCPCGSGMKYKHCCGAKA